MTKGPNGSFRKSPPQSAQELLERYQSGERNFSPFPNEEGTRICANLTGANLTGANLQAAILARANLAGAHLEGAHLEGVDLAGADLAGANLLRAHLQRVYPGGVELQYGSLAGANLAGAILAGADLRRANLAGANLLRANLLRADLARANLARANLAGANLLSARLKKANLEGANLEGVDLEDANLQRANLQRANLQRANLQRAELRGADLEGATVDGADLSRAAFDHSSNLLAAIWNTVRFGEDTYHRDRVDRGEQVLPIAQPDPLRFVFQTTTELTGEELEAMHDLVRSFGSVTDASQLMFQFVKEGKQLVVESHSNPTEATEAARIALGIVRHSQASPTLASLQDLQAMTHQVLENQNWQAARDGVAAARLERVLRSLELIEVVFPNKQALKDFVEVTTKAGVSLQPARKRGSRVLKFGKATVNSPAVAGLAALGLALATGQDPFTAGLIGQGTTAAAEASKQVDSDDKKKP